MDRRQHVEGSPVSRLPVSLTRFVGRTGEMRGMRRLMASDRLVTVVGIGGCGKTRVALEFATRHGQSFSGGVWWIDLAGLPAGSSPAAAAVDALRVRLRAGQTDHDAVVSYLRDRRALIVFDNCEHMLGRCAAIVEQLMAECPHLAVVATSREPLGVAGETVFRLPTLTVPDNTVSLEHLKHCDAVRLFLDRAHAASGSFRVTSQTLDTIGQICVRLDGIPLAIELAAAHIEALSPRQILDALGQGFEVLATHERSKPPKHQTLRASMDWSHNLLDRDEKVLFRRLSVFTGVFSLEAARRVCADDILGVESVLLLFTRLVRKSLISVVEEDASGCHRYRLLDVVQKYATSKLEESGETDQVHDRLVDYVLGLIDGLQLTIYETRASEWVKLTRAEYPLLLAALKWAFSHPSGDAAARLANGLAHVVANSTNPRDGQRLLETAVEASDSEPSPVLVCVLSALAIIAGVVVGDLARARGHARQALVISTQLNDPVLRARVLSIMGSIENSWDPSEARKFLRQSLEVAERCGDGWAGAHALIVIAVSYSSQGRVRRAREAAGQAAEVIERVGVTGPLAAWYWLALSQTALQTGDLTGCVAAATKARECAQHVEEQLALAFAHLWHASATRWLGDSDPNAMPSGVPVHWRPPHGAPFAAAPLSLAQARDTTSHQTGGQTEALTREALELSREASARMLEGECLLDLAEMALANGELSEARAHLTAALEPAAAIKSPWLEACATARLARLAHAESHPDEAMRLAGKALALQRDHGYRFEAIRTLLVIADTYRDQQAIAEAARLYGAVDTACQRLGLTTTRDQLTHPHPTTTPPEHRADEPAEADAWGQGDEWKEGTALALDEAITYALRRHTRAALPASGWGSLTSRELAIIRLIADGHTNTEIARHFSIALSTVKVHLSHIFQKVDVANRVELAAAAGQRFSTRPPSSTHNPSAQ